MSAKVAPKSNRLNKKHKSIDLFIEDRNNVKSNLKQNTSLQQTNGDSCSDCNCDDHSGQIYLNQTFDMPFSYLFECIFDFNEFYYEFIKTRKISEFKADDWKIENGFKTRRTDYLIEVTGVIGAKHCKNIEYLKVVKYVDNEICIVDTENYSSGIMYADCFKICHRYCLTNCTSKKRCKLVVHSSIVYLTKPNFLIKNLIDKNCVASLTDFFNGMSVSLYEECTKLKHFNESIVKTSTQLDLQGSSISSLKSSPSASSLSSAREFSSDVETSESDNTNLIRRASTRNKLINKNNDLDATKTNDNNKQPVSNVTMENSHEQSKKKYPNSNSLNQISIKSHTKSKVFMQNKSHSDETKSTSLNVKTDLFIKFFFVLMVFLLLLNFILYAKLREIEKIAITIKKHPKYNL